MTTSDPTPTPSAPSGLPITAYREAIQSAIQAHPVVIIAGDTGSGKTTQIPQYCLASGRGDRGLIGCTQPRRVAAVSVAERVAEELQCPVGGLVGWQHRFERKLSSQTRIKFMTDGILLAESRADPDLRRYDTLMIDEAHERTLNIDFLLGYLRQRLTRRRDLKVVISSATLDVARFSEFFGGAPVVEVPGKLHPVEVRYRPPRDDDDDLARLVADAVEDLQGERSGDILVFLPGERDIRAAADTLRGRALPGTEILPFMASLPPAEQRRVFHPQPGRRRVILSTNVAETSLTLPGIRMVVDSGLARISRFTHRTQTQRLHIEPVSRASAEQRKGRCGRLGPGVCVRLYSEEDLARRDAYTEPEIRRTSLGGVILTMADLRLGRLEQFPLLDPPSPVMVREGYRELSELAALDDQHRLTPLGRTLARFPLEPRFARMLLAAHEGKTLRDALVVVAALACDDPRLRPVDHQEEADRHHARFQTDTSDFAGLLLLWRWYHETALASSRGAARRLCTEQFISFRRMEEWVDVREQLERTVKNLGLDPASASPGDTALHRALLTGMLSHIGMRDPEKGDYRGARGLRFAVHPGSGLFKKQPAWLMAAELVDTARLYARRIAAIQVDWLEPAAAHLCKHSYHSPYWDAKAGTARALERVTLHGLLIADGRRRDYSRIDPAFSRELFIRHGLVAGELPPPIPEPARANLALFAALRDARHKVREEGSQDDDAFAEAYGRVLPAECVNLPALRNWLGKATPEEAARLRFSATDFPSVDAPSEVFPDRVRLGGQSFRLTYRHEQGAEDDGITCSLPIAAIPLLRRWRHDWLVPGALPGKIAWMLSRIPKSAARKLPSTTLAATRLTERLGPPEGPLAEALSVALADEYHVSAPPSLWPDSDLPPPWRMRFRILDGDRREVFVSREPSELDEFHAEVRRLTKTEPVPSAAPALSTAGLRDLENLTSWSCGDLPDAVEAGQAGWPVVNYPALAEVGTTVSLRWYADRREAHAAHRHGIRRLYALALGKAFQALASGGVPPRDVQLAYLTLGGQASALREEAAWAALDAVLVPPTEPLPRTAEAFGRRLTERQGLLASTARAQHQTAQAVVVLASSRESELAAAKLPEETVADLHEQLGWLVFPGFCRHTPPDRMLHYGRYLEAIRLRIERARSNPAKDIERLRLVKPYWERGRDALTDAARTGLDPVALSAYRWAVEEYRVSLFAQELRTPEPVSPQRLDRLWEALGPHG